jgi:hypothetical protein
MSYSLTINFTPPTGNGYQFVTEYRVKYWPTASPTNVSTVFTTAFPLVLTDLNSTSYSGTIEAKCGSNYGSPRSFGPIAIAGSSGGGGGTTPACPYRVVLYEDESVSYPIGASGNTTGCTKPGYRIKLTTSGGVLVTTSTALTVGVTYTVETGDCASPTNTETLSTTLTIPAGSSISSGASGTAATCYNYNVVANNGTNNRETVEWSYVSCAGVTVNRSTVNTNDADVCARQGSISGSVDDTEGTACGTVTASGAYLQVIQANQRISNVSFSVGNPTTLVNGSLTCNLTYTGGGSALPTRTVYLNAVEYNTAPNATVRWFLSNMADGMQLTLGNLLPFSIRIGYAITGTGVSGGNGNTSQEVIISGLDLPAGESSVSQGTTGVNWYGLRNTNLRFSTIAGPTTFDYSVNGITVFNDSGGSVNNPVTYTYNGTVYTIHVYRNYTLTSSF